MFWVFDWLREAGLDSNEKIATALKDRKVFRNLQETARSIGANAIGESGVKPQLIAGAGIDLTGVGQCTMHAECVLLQVNDLVRHVWHYFDHVSIMDMTPIIASTSFKKINMPMVQAWLQALRIIESIGAADMLHFEFRPSFCQDCLTNHAGVYGLEQIVEHFDEIVDILVDGSSLSVHPIGNGVYSSVEFASPAVKAAWHRKKEATTRINSLGEDALKRDMATNMLRRAYHSLFNDVGHAQLSGAPLGATADMHRFLLGRSGKESDATVQQVIFNLQLPMLDNVPLKELIAVRKHEGALFSVFQDNLRAAVEETINEIGADDIGRITARVQESRIEPDLHRIRYALEKNKNSLVRTWSMAAIGASVVTVGTLAVGHDPVFSAGASAVIAAAGMLQNALTAKDDVTKSKMYFLFKASQAAIQRGREHGALVVTPH